MVTRRTIELRAKGTGVVSTAGGAGACVHVNGGIPAGVSIVAGT